MRFRDRYWWHFAQFRWGRKWIGGRWSLWMTHLPMSAVWVRGWERPPCGFSVAMKQEDWQ